jgi:hypothetical protein
MRARKAAVLAAAACVAGCALLPDDRFAGHYRVADPRDRTHIEIVTPSPGRWEMRYDDRDPDPHNALVAASRAELNRWFGDGAPVKDINCLATTGPQAHPVLCAVPRDAALGLDRRNAARGSRTGWILVAPASGGLTFGDLVRER